MKQGYFKTGKRLEIALDNIDRIDGLQDYLDQSWIYLLFDVDCGSIPTWEQVNNGSISFIPYWMTEGSIDYAITSDNPNYEKYKDLDDLESLRCEYVQGYHDGIEYGETITLFDPIDNKEKEYAYLVSVGNIGSEQEEQAENGDLVYYYRGESFCRIFLPVE
jgi:hypothetical protein